MAEVLLRAALSPDSPWRVASAGLAAGEGTRASDHAIAAVGEVGCDLRDHRSRALTAERVREADAIVAMTSGHAQQIAERFPNARDRIHLLRTFASTPSACADIHDPFCGTLDDYRRCRDVIRLAIPGLVHFLEQTESSVSKT